MKINHRWLLKALVPAAALTLSSLPAQAQNYYSTDFSSADTGLSATGSTYSSPTTAPTDPLSGQNGWASNDGTVTAGTPGTSTQLVGNSNYVGQYGSYFGGTFAGSLGGIYRYQNPSGSAPDVVPSSNATGGVVSLYHPITFAGTGLAFNVDFVVTKPGIGGYPTRDAFAFTLGNASTNLLTINFAQSANDPANQDTLAVTTGANNLGVGGTTTSTGNGVVLNAQYHLSIVVSNALTGAFTLTLQGQSGPAVTVTGTAGPFTATSLTQAGVLWNLGDKTLTNGAYQNAGDNVIAFDNFSLTVPEPSTYALLALGAAGLMWAARRRAEQS